MEMDERDEDEIARLLGDRKQTIICYLTEDRSKVVVVAPSTCWWHFWCRFAPTWALKRWPPTMCVTTVEVTAGQEAEPWGPNAARVGEA